MSTSLSKKRVARSDDSDLDDAGSSAAAHAKKARTSEKSSGAAVPGGGERDPNGDPYWEISNQRRLTVSEFKGRVMVSLREYYEKDGQTLPGKKGITMPVAQLAAIIKLLPAVEKVLVEKGETLPRPDYVSSTTHNEEEDDIAGDQPTRDRKRNFEETSEED